MYLCTHFFAQLHTNSTRTCKNVCNIWKETKFPPWGGPLLFPFHRSNSRGNSRSFFKVVLKVSGSRRKHFEVYSTSFTSLFRMFWSLLSFNCGFSFPFLGRTQGPPWVGKMTPHPYFVSPFPLPCPSQLTLHHSAGCRTFDPRAIWFMSVQCQIWAISMWHYGGVCGLMVTS